MVGEPVAERAGGGPEPRGRTRAEWVAGDLRQMSRILWQRAARHVHHAPLRHQVGHVVKYQGFLLAP